MLKYQDAAVAIDESYEDLTAADELEGATESQAFIGERNPSGESDLSNRDKDWMRHFNLVCAGLYSIGIYQDINQALEVVDVVFKSLIEPGTAHTYDRDIAMELFEAWYPVVGLEISVLLRTAQSTLGAPYTLNHYAWQAYFLGENAPNGASDATRSELARIQKFLKEDSLESQAKKCIAELERHLNKENPSPLQIQSIARGLWEAASEVEKTRIPGPAILCHFFKAADDDLEPVADANDKTKLQARVLKPSSRFLFSIRARNLEQALLNLPYSKVSYGQPHRTSGVECVMEAHIRNLRLRLDREREVFLNTWPSRMPHFRVDVGSGMIVTLTDEVQEEENEGDLEMDLS
ncbi:hypothetical protein PG985_007771 [Apiospora marii]|uniref:uncharacterized protein n=1 Tax=Apiospora marii TaxID=335849 RepID=UPI003131BC65